MVPAWPTASPLVRGSQLTIPFESKLPFVKPPSLATNTIWVCEGLGTSCHRGQIRWHADRHANPDFCGTDLNR